MENSEVLKQARTLWLANFSIALSPFFFTVLILEFAKYEKVREMLIVKLSDYQPAFLAALLGVIVMLIIQGYKFYSNISAFTAEGSSLSRDAVFSKAASLKKQLGYFLKIAKLGLLVSIPVYLSGLNYIYAILLAAPSIMAYIACSKVYYLRLAPSVKPLNCWTLFCTKFTPPPPGACIRHEPWPEWHSHVAEAANAG